MDSTVTGTNAGRKKHSRRRVADNLSNSPATTTQQSPATKLLAALSKAQGKSAPDPMISSRQTSQGHKIKAEPTTPRQKAEPRKRGGGTQSQNATVSLSHGFENSNSVGARMTKNQVTMDEVGPSTSNPRRVRDNSYNQNQSATESYSLWSSSPIKAPTSVPKIPHEVLQDLTFRFLANIPDEEKSDKVRMCFQVELAHWFYVDFYCKQEERKDCAQMGMREFARQIFKHCDELAPYAAHVDQVIDEWRWYKSTVPTYGAILLDESLNHVLLVQGFYASKNSWGFPKGKVNEGEEPRSCAVREVFEETGFNFGDHRPRGGEKKLQKFVNETMVRLYIVPDVPTNFPFAPQTRNEIRKIQWFNVWDLPTDRNDQFHKLGILSNHNFYTVMPFVQDLQKYIVREQERRALAAAESQKLRDKQHVLLPSFVDNKASSSVPSSDISAVMDALFSSSVFPNPAGAASDVEFKSATPQKAPNPTLADAAQSAPSNVQSLPSKLQHSFFSHDSVLTTPSSSRLPTSGNISSPPQTSQFRPLDHNPLSKSVMNVLTGTSVKPPRSSIEKGVPRIAHPIAIPAQPVPPPLVDRPVYVAPKIKEARINLSETSAFKAFKSPSVDSPVNIPCGAADKIEVELQKLLCGSSHGDEDSFVTAHGADDRTTSAYLDSFSPDVDIGSEFTYMAGVPSDGGHQGLGYVLPLERADRFIVQLCDAWKDFKLDRNAIFAGLPGFEVAR